MLVLGRKINESILIGDDIVITFLGEDFRGEMVFGITAPRDIRVDRLEVRKRIEHERRQDDR